MVLQKRLDYGFNGYQVPPTPRGCRSARGKKRSFSRKIENDQMCAFELLAAVAGKLLQEGESSPASSKVCTERAQPAITKDPVKKEQQDEEKILKVEPCDQGSCDESVFIAEPGLQGHNQNRSPRKFSHSQKNASLGYASSCPQKVSSVEESTIGKSRSDVVKSTSKIERDRPRPRPRPRHAESYKGKVDRGFGTRKIGSISGGCAPDVYNYEDPMEFDSKPPALVSSDSSVEVPARKDPISSGTFHRRRDETKAVNGDEDENSSGYTQPSIVTLKSSKAPSRIGEWRARKLLGSRYWKVAPKLKDRELSNRDGEMRPVFRNRKTCYTRERSQKNLPFKRRKLFHQYSASTSDHGISSEGISSSPKKFNEGLTIGSGSGTSSSAIGEQSSFQFRDSHVKLSIKSFKIPELFIEIPETATVGSLKRTVMEALTAILGGGLSVGVLLQGKKVRDDNRTLVQTGICHDNQLDGLGFALEPNTTPVPAALSAEDPSFLLPCHTPQPLNRYPVTPTIEPGTSDVSLTTPTTNVGNCVESDHDSVPTPDISANKTASDSRALVPIPPASGEALAVVPLNRKSRRSELVQRRIRRPFSVSEVEALVQAVEKLGTGRWRDVKLRAFDNAKHRTYVDLKDKWKTLVHTARISPQQRRGEPVPQELLDRVLAAHAYWSQQQAKQQIKQ